MYTHKDEKGSEPYSNKGGRGKNGKDKKNKTNLMMQLPLTSIPWYVQFGRLTTYK